ncbi:MAG: aminoacetone oxidase family FAD-binding enzyme [Firmicutes bacterium]|nr:aminoacetone oxidase family FAD-binding enzyme [Bacillota bacterium]
MKKTIVIGAGASGMMAAIKASEVSDVTLIESNDKCGKKILLTGNGKCNYWNDNICLDNYFTDDVQKLKEILKMQTEVLDFLYKLGLYPKIKNGYYYPYSSQASSVREIFELELQRRKINILYNSKVHSIKKENNIFYVTLENKTLEADVVIIATGSKACPKTGSDGSGYDLARSLGHQINPVMPALVQLKANEFFLKEWNGVRQDAHLTLYINGKETMSEEGELQMTQDGISGICTFNISSMASRALGDGQDVLVKINFSPFLNESFYDFFDKRASIISNQTVGELLESILNYKLINVILKRSNLTRNVYWKSLTENEKRTLCANIDAFELRIIDTNPIEKGQVCTGGVSLKEIDENMQSTICENLYLVGEVLDVDGKCGGFNLAFAFISGYIAGKAL